jgi:RNA recognition motif-containing protein
MSNRLYVGNLAFGTSTESLQAAFAEAGEVVDVKIITDRETGQPRGFGFVTMGSQDAARRAITQLNGAMLDGRALRVNEAEERQQGGGGGGGGGFRGTGGGGGQRGAKRQRW